MKTLCHIFFLIVCMVVLLPSYSASAQGQDKSSNYCQVRTNEDYDWVAIAKNVTQADCWKILDIINAKSTKNVFGQYGSYDASYIPRIMKNKDNDRNCWYLDNVLWKNQARKVRGHWVVVTTSLTDKNSKDTCMAIVRAIGKVRNQQPFYTMAGYQNKHYYFDPTWQPVMADYNDEDRGGGDYGGVPVP
jgi:hypothetical protein